MDTEEEMFEEHLDEEYQNSEIDEDFEEYQKQIEELERAQLQMKHDREVQKKLEKAIMLLRLHLQNYQRIIIFNRRRARQRLKRRQGTLRNCFLQSLMEMQIIFMEMLPLAIEPHVLMELKNKLSLQRNSYCRESKENDEEQQINYYKDVAANFTDTQWLDTFHMPKHIFRTICSKLKPLLEEQTNMDFESWLSMCIYTVANGGKFSSVGMLFKLEKKFVRQSLYKFVEYFLQEFSDNRLSLPQNVHDLDKIAKAFHRASNLFPCVGVVHIFELPNQCSCEHYKCGTERVIVQVCIDDRLLFRKVEIADPKPTIFLTPTNEISCIWKKINKDSTVPYFVIAPPQFPLRTWLMQKYEKPQKIWEHIFNRSFDNLNIFREVSMKALFGRWQILCSTECIPPEKKTLIIKACCMLHNLLEDSGEIVSEEWCKDINLFKYEHKITPNFTKCFNESHSATEKRDEIAKLIGLVRNQEQSCTLNTNTNFSFVSC